MRRLALAVALLAGCVESTPDDPVTAESTSPPVGRIAIAELAPTVTGWRAPYPGQDGDHIRAVSARLTCAVASPAVLLCVQSTDPYDAGSLRTIEECTWMPCTSGEAIELETPSTFIAGERSRISVVLDHCPGAAVAAASVLVSRP